MSQIELSINIVEKKRVVSELFKQYYSEMCKAAFNITRDKVVSEDIVQNVFLKLYKSEISIVIEFPRAYLKRLTINESIDYYRKTEKVQNIEIDSVKGLSIDNEDDSERQELLKRVNNAINELPEKCRLVFVLKRKEGLTNQEIADELEISIKTVENQMTKAFKMLREKLGVLSFYLTYIILEL